MKKEEIEKLKNENEHLKKEYELVSKENDNLKKENSTAYDMVRQRNREKGMILKRLMIEINRRIEIEAELDILKEEAEELPF